MSEKDSYKTILKSSEEVLFKDRNSKFFGYAFPITNGEDVKNNIETLKKMHHAARHWCYAWQLGKKYESFRVNDDGEPSNSAGMPIYGQLQSFDVTNILVVVVRYFGGTKLGVSGLINAYRSAAQMALENSKIINKTIDILFCIKFEYEHMNKVMRIIKEQNLTITKQELEMSCKIYISVREKEAQRIFNIFENLYPIEIKKEKK